MKDIEPTPQLLHPQPEQSPEQAPQLAQLQGVIVGSEGYSVETECDYVIVLLG